MIDSADAVLELLCQDYGSATAARALWQWSGGEEREVSFPGDVEALWSGLWSQAQAEGQAVSQMTLAREVLYDQPGNPLILEFLAETAATLHPDALAAADVLLFHFERLRRLGYPVACLREYLDAFPADTWEAAFAALAPAVHEWSSPQDRDRLYRRLDQVTSLTRTIEQLDAMRDRLRAAQGAGDEREAALAALDELRAVEEQLDESDAYSRGVRARVRKLLAQLEFRRQPSPRSIAAGLTTLLARCRKLTGPENLRLGELAQAIRAALLGTRPRDEDDLDEDDLDEDEE